MAHLPPDLGLPSQLCLLLLLYGLLLLMGVGVGTEPLLLAMCVLAAKLLLKQRAIHRCGCVHGPGGTQYPAISGNSLDGLTGHSMDVACC